MHEALPLPSIYIPIAPRTETMLHNAATLACTEINTLFAHSDTSVRAAVRGSFALWITHEGYWFGSQRIIPNGSAFIDYFNASQPHSTPTAPSLHIRRDAQGLPALTSSQTKGVFAKFNGPSTTLQFIAAQRKRIAEALEAGGMTKPPLTPETRLGLITLRPAPGERITAAERISSKGILARHLAAIGIADIPIHPPVVMSGKNRLTPGIVQ